jgi:hypothetical protein
MANLQSLICVKVDGNENLLEEDIHCRTMSERPQGQMVRTAGLTVSFRSQGFISNADKEETLPPLQLKEPEPKKYTEVEEGGGGGGGDK